MIDRSVRYDDVDSEGNEIELEDDSDDDQDLPELYSKSIPLIEFCIKTQIFSQEYSPEQRKQIKYVP